MTHAIFKWFLNIFKNSSKGIVFVIATFGREIQLIQSSNKPKPNQSVNSVPIGSN